MTKCCPATLHAADYSCHISSQTFHGCINHAHMLTIVMHPCRAALARSKGWAPRPLPQPKLQSTADNTAADNAATPASATGGSGTGGAAVLPLPWRDPGLRFTSAPTVEDDEGGSNTRQAGKPEEEQKGMVTEQDQVRHDLAVNHMY